MVFIRAYSIQDILRNINRRLTFYDVTALFSLVVIISATFFIIKGKDAKRFSNVVYVESKEEEVLNSPSFSQIFASKSGKTYTYSWCQGAGRIKEENKIYFTTEGEAEASGRGLSKLCK
ncbi:MAG: hypothetical protein KBC21_01195 [Candidatus Pacebacteria bacterium]|jgi:hypothetical protein|nr:hypothetical protein [Candidatus Paceibacterota bacterium]